MKNILCYGDSNTYGYNPENGQRYDYNIRWTGILQNLLGLEYRVIEEVAKTLEIEFMDASKITEPSEIDALHLSVSGHRALGEAFAKRCLQILAE